METLKDSACKFYKNLRVIKVDLERNEIIFSFTPSEVPKSVKEKLIHHAKDVEYEYPIDSLEDLESAKALKLFLSEFEELFSIPFFPNEKIFFQRLSNFLKEKLEIETTNFSVFFSGIMYSVISEI